MQLKEKWEILRDDAVVHTVVRLKIHGGWLVKTTEPIGVALVFVPDAKHKWKIK